MGGLVGLSEGNCTYESCFAEGTISAEVERREGTIGAVIGWAYSVNLNDDVYYPPLYRYEVAYNHDYRMPWYWDGLYTDFGTLAAVLNEGQDAVWENTEGSSSPSLIWWNELSASGKEPTEWTVFLG